MVGSVMFCISVEGGYRDWIWGLRVSVIVLFLYQ